MEYGIKDRTLPGLRRQVDAARAGRERSDR